MFNSIIGSGLSVINFSICVVTSIILGFIVAYLHMKTTRSNQNFINTLVILPVLVTVVILLVNGNLGTSVAVVGAFLFVRFTKLNFNFSIKSSANFIEVFVFPPPVGMFK